MLQVGALCNFSWMSLWTRRDNENVNRKAESEIERKAAKKEIRAVRRRKIAFCTTCWATTKAIVKRRADVDDLIFLLLHRIAFRVSYETGGDLRVSEFTDELMPVHELNPVRCNRETCVGAFSTISIVNANATNALINPTRWPCRLNFQHWLATRSFAFSSRSNAVINSKFLTWETLVRVENFCPRNVAKVVTGKLTQSAALIENHWNAGEGEKLAYLACVLRQNHSITTEKQKVASTTSCKRNNACSSCDQPK